MLLIDLDKALAILAAGDVVSIPTETVYGLAGNAYDPEAVERIFQLKQRPIKNPLIVHYATLQKLKADVQWTPLAEKLSQLMPAPLTLVLEKRLPSALALAVSGGQPTVAVRIPKHPITQQILRALPFPLAAPSANPSGKLSPTQAGHVISLLPSVPCVEGGSSHAGLESTVVDVRGDKALILRPGSLSREDLEALVPCSIAQKADPVFLSPGLFPKHYAPQKPLFMNQTEALPTDGLLTFGPTYPESAKITVHLSQKSCLAEAAQKLFGALHQLDAESCERIVVMPIPNQGLGVAINDRLQRAAS